MDSFSQNILSESNNGLSFRKIQKFQKKQRKYARFNTMIIPAEYRSDAAAKSSMERKIWRFYIYQIIFRTMVDFGFLTVQWLVYPYRFIVPEIFVCSTDPCPYQVNCFVSRPTEKTIFFNYKYIIGLITCIINVLELWYIGWIRIRRAFQEDPSPPYFDSLGAGLDPNRTQAGSECFSSTHDSMSLPPIPPPMSIPEIHGMPNSGIRKLSKDQFSPLEPISASTGSGSEKTGSASGRSSSKNRLTRKQQEQHQRRASNSPKIKIDKNQSHRI
ncbi:Oidioi.mRNA.OKI2018_I69.chr1.g332.t1.cds [Oikopleura dioica]|uniref:Gap junction protein n=1 Tax=Oikopleura dioica TaxID=34765 RepID=A0ABN7SK02_OIKDI|nr:Oidioi.mRNA.OKI2018_I69.chr1.g332.t1.cds [Oikopleura dioica]